MLLINQYNCIKVPLILLGIFISGTIISCNKNNHVKTTAEKLQGKWQLNSIKTNSYYNNSDHINSQTFAPSDYWEFRSDGTFHTSVGGSVSSTTYTIKNDTTIIIGANVQTDIIKVLTDHSLQLYDKFYLIASPSDYDEDTYDLTR